MNTSTETLKSRKGLKADGRAKSKSKQKANEHGNKPNPPEPLYSGARPEGDRNT